MQDNNAPMISIPSDCEGEVQNSMLKMHDISSVVVDPNQSFLNSMFTKIDEYVANTKYNPSITEKTVSSSALIPLVTLSDIEPFSNKITKVKNYKVAFKNFQRNS